MRNPEIGTLLTDAVPPTAQAAFDAGLTAHHGGQLERARACYAQCLAQAPHHPAALYLTGLAWQQEHAFSTAIDWFERAADADTADADAAFGIAQCARALGQTARAAAACARAAALAPDRADILDAWGTALLDTGDAAGAVDRLSRACALDPHPWSSQSNLGNALHATGRLVDALAAHDRAVERGAHVSLAHRNRAVTLLALGRADEARTAFERARTIAPDDVDAWNGEGAALAALERHREALACFGEALARAPQARAPLFNRAVALQATGQWSAAIDAWEHAVRAGAGDGARIRSAIALPVIPASQNEIDDARARFAREIAQLRGTGLQVRRPEVEVAMTAFHLTYHGLCNRDLLAALAALHLEACPELGWRADHVDRGPRRSGRVRVGFVSRFLHDHSIGKTSRGLIARLDRRQFEVVALHAGPPRADATHAFVRAHADRNVDLPGDLAAARTAIAALELDVLFFQDIGMDPFTYFLAFARLAPVQCVSFGHPDTTGIPSMDWWVSTDGFEPADGDAHYSERLHRLPQVGTPAYYYRPPATTGGSRSRGELGLPEDRAIHFCPHSVFRFTPRFDRLLAQLLADDLRAELWLVDPNPDWTRLVLRRFAMVMPDTALARIRVLPRQPHADYLALMQAADSVLDPIDFNGMNNTLDAFAAGVPVVTWPQAMQRGRHAYGMYRAMEWTQCVADSEDAWVALARRLAGDAAFRAHCRETVASRRDVLFEDARVPQAFEAFFHEALATASGGACA